MTDIKTLCSSLLDDANDPVPAVDAADALTFDVIPPEQRPVGATATLAELGIQVSSNDNGVRYVLSEQGTYMAPPSELFELVVLKWIPELSQFDDFAEPPIGLFGDPNKTGGVYAVPNRDYSPENPPTADTIAIKIA